MHSLLTRGMHGRGGDVVLTVLEGLAQWVAFRAQRAAARGDGREKRSSQAARVIGLPGYLIAVAHVCQRDRPVMVIGDTISKISRSRS